MANSMSNVVVGRRQILRELKKGNVAEIIIAADAEASYIASIIDAAKLAGVSYKLHGTMSEISQNYRIDVPSGAVGVLK